MTNEERVASVQCRSVKMEATKFSETSQQIPIDQPASQLSPPVISTKPNG